MSILEDYEKRCGLPALTSEQISRRIDLAEACLESPAVGDPRLHTESIIVWLHDRLLAMCYAIEHPGVPVASRCAWCFRAGPETDEAWGALPKMTMDDAATHSQVCEHNPLVQEIRRLTALLEDFRGRALGIDDGLRDAIRALLKTEPTSGELRRALGELVR